MTEKLLKRIPSPLQKKWLNKIHHGDSIEIMDVKIVYEDPAAIDDALFSARTMTGRDGITVYGLPFDAVKPLLAR